MFCGYGFGDFCLFFHGWCGVWGILFSFRLVLNRMQLTGKLWKNLINLWDSGWLCIGMAFVLLLTLFYIYKENEAVTSVSVTQLSEVYYVPQSRLFRFWESHNWSRRNFKEILFTVVSEASSDSLNYVEGIFYLFSSLIVKMKIWMINRGGVVYTFEGLSSTCVEGRGRPFNGNYCQVQ